MKLHLICLCALVAIHAPAQMGYGSRPPAGPSQSDVLNNPSAAAQQAIAERQRANAEAARQYQYATWVPTDPYRLIGTNVYAARSPGWFQVSGNIVERRTNGMVIEGYYGLPYQDYPFGGTFHTNRATIFVMHLPYPFANGRILPEHGIMAEKVDMPVDGVVAVFDYGQVFQKRKMAGATKGQDEKHFNSLLSQATNGVAWAQYSVAICYLNGTGCETNREEAIGWLNKAAAQGSVEASNKLAHLGDGSSVSVSNP